jgi:signal transduction histidine kinase
MEERVALVGGTFQIQSAPGEGTAVVASFPIAKAA